MHLSYEAYDTSPLLKRQIPTHPIQSCFAPPFPLPMPPSSPSFSPTWKYPALPLLLNFLPPRSAVMMSPMVANTARTGWCQAKLFKLRKNPEIRPVVDLAWIWGGFLVTLLIVSRMEVRLGRMGSPEMVVSQ